MPQAGVRAVPEGSAQTHVRRWPAWLLVVQVACSAPHEGAGTTTLSTATAEVASPTSRGSAPETSGSATRVGIDECQSNTDCVYSEEDGCCVKTVCRENARSESKTRYQERQSFCARMDCTSPPNPKCSADDTRRFAKCSDHRCVVGR